MHDVRVASSLGPRAHGMRQHRGQGLNPVPRVSAGPAVLQQPLRAPPWPSSLPPRVAGFTVLCVSYHGGMAWWELEQQACGGRFSDLGGVIGTAVTLHKGHVQCEALRARSGQAAKCPCSW